MNYADLIGKDLRHLFPSRDWSRCSVGIPSGNGLKLGFEGWGDPDVVLHPGIPLDVAVDQLGLNGKFDQVECNEYLNCIHGDCTLTHAALGVYNLLAKGGTAKITCIDTMRIASDVFAAVHKGDFIKGQMLEKFLFRPAVDASGLIRQQTLLDAQRIATCFKRKAEQFKASYTPERLSPDAVRLPDILDAEWEKGGHYNKLQEDLTHDWPNCIRCQRLATKMDADRAYYSRYCKNHYAEAREKCDRDIIDAYTFVLVFR